MKKNIIPALLLALPVAFFSCNNMPQNGNERNEGKYPQGSFGYDLGFLQQQDDSLVVLKSRDAAAQAIVSPKYQGKVFTSTSGGLPGMSFGWVNYKAFSGQPDPHFNAYGSENRCWIGPEGGRYALFFPPGDSMVFDNWKVPAAFDTEPWQVLSKSDSGVALHKDMVLENYAGTKLSLSVTRTVTLLDPAEISGALQIAPDDSVKAVGYRTDNTLINTGTFDWTEQTGMPCLWILDMFRPSPQTVIVVPYRHPEDTSSRIATTDYFGEIPPGRIRFDHGVILFRADGKSRGKIGVPPQRARHVAGSYDAQNRVLTIIRFDVDSTGRYLNQEWKTHPPVFGGDAVNAYNDGPLANGTQMGPFYEMESVSPAASLKKGASLEHRQEVFHFTGSEAGLDTIARQVLGVSLGEIESL